MIVLDTHVLLWWISLPGALSPAARKAIDSADVLGVSAVSAWEIATLVRKKRIAFDRPVREWIDAALAGDRVHELPVTAAIGVVAGSFGEEFHGDPADRIIAATSLAHGAPLVTRDEALRAMPMLQALW